MAVVDLEIRAKTAQAKRNMAVLSQSFDSVEKDFKELSKSLKGSLGEKSFNKLNSQLKFVKNNFDTFGDAVDANRKTVSLLKNTMNSLLKQGVSPTSDEMRRLSRTYEQAKARTEQLRKANSGLGKSFKANSFSLKSLIGISGGLAVGFTAAIATIRGVTNALSGAFTAARDFNKEIKNVTTLTNELSFDEIKKGVLALDPLLGSVKDLTNGLYQSISAGVEAGDAIAFTAQSAKFAKAALTDTNTAVDVITTALNAYGAEASHAGYVSDVFFNTIKQGKTTGAELASSIGQSIPLFASAGIHITELTAGLATMTKLGQSTAEATTQLNAIVTAFLKPSEALSDALKESGYESGAALLQTEGLAGALDLLQKASGGSQSKLASLLPNVRALRGAMSLLTDGSKVYNKTLLSYKEIAGTTDEAFKKQIDSIDKAKAEIDKLKVTFGGLIFEVLAAFAPAVTPIINAINTIDFDAYISLAKDFAGAFVSVITVLSEVFTLLIHIQNFMFRISAWFLSDLYKAVDKVLKSIKDVINIVKVGVKLLFKSLFDKESEITFKEAVTKIFTAIFSIYKSLFFKFLSGIINKVIEIIKKVSFLKDIAEKLGEIENITANLTENFKSDAKNIFDEMQKLAGVTEEITEEAEDASDAFNGITAPVINIDANSLLASIKKSANQAEETWFKTFAKIKKGFDNTSGYMKKAVDNSIVGLSSMLNASIDFTSKVFSIVGDEMSEHMEKQKEKYSKEIEEARAKGAEAYNAFVATLKEDFTLTTEAIKEIIASSLNLIADYVGSISDLVIQSLATENAYANQSDKLAANRKNKSLDKEKKKLIKHIKSLGLSEEAEKTRIALVEEKIQKKKDDTNFEFEQKKYQRQVEIFNIQKRFKILEILINAAAAGLQAMAQLGPLGGPIAIAIIAAMAAAQTFLVASQKPPPPPMRAAGGLENFVVPAGYDSDNYMIGTRSGESVTVEPEIESDSDDLEQQMIINIHIGTKAIGTAITQAIKNGEVRIQI